MIYYDVSRRETIQAPTKYVESPLSVFENVRAWLIHYVGLSTVRDMQGTTHALPWSSVGSYNDNPEIILSYHHLMQKFCQVILITY